MYKLSGLLCTLALFLPHFVSAQTVDDALRYSQTQVAGTARYAATAGALTPLGADFSVLSTNPAGLAWVRTSDFHITPLVDISQVDASLLSGSGNAARAASRSQFSLASAGFLIAGTNNRSPNWSTFNFGIGLNRLADFNEQFRYEGRSNGSLVEAFVEDANAGFFDAFGNELGLETGAVLEDNQGFFSDFDTNPAAVINREQTVTRTGSINELLFSMAGNFRERVMFGFSLGVPFLDYTESKQYTEFDGQQEVDFFDDLSYGEELITTGAGVNFKFGMIVRPTQPLRLSVAVHSPTFYRLEDIFTTSFTYNFTFDGVPDGGTAFSPEGSFTYSLHTPWKFMGGAGVLLGRKGFLSGHLEYTDYQGAQFRFADFPQDEAALNRDIDGILSNSLAMRLGGEYVIDPVRVRAGMQLRQSPYEGENDMQATYAGGVGFMFGRFYLDLAYQFRQNDELYTPYQTRSLPLQQVSTDYSHHNVLMTLGVKL